jgi:hypothetical protein
LSTFAQQLLITFEIQKLNGFIQRQVELGGSLSTFAQQLLITFEIQKLNGFIQRQVELHLAVYIRT